MVEERKGDVCDMRHAGMFDRWYRRFLQNPDKMFRGLVSPGMTVMDIGCGPGYFTVGMAKLVGESGTVIAADVQQGMLDLTAEKCRREGVSKRVRLHLTGHESIGAEESLDFALAFYMVHEVPDRLAFLRELSRMLKPGGHLYIAEPAFLFFLRGMFNRALRAAEQTGFALIRTERMFMARCAVLRKL